MSKGNNKVFKMVLIFICIILAGTVNSKHDLRYPLDVSKNNFMP